MLALFLSVFFMMIPPLRCCTLQQCDMVRRYDTLGRWIDFGGQGNTWPVSGQ